ncbi:hypothetical protein [Priestia megaterium]|uniref:hypothetical protein n=1 Tax=Priestia megaterium TaxID=1404 RepID=UPI00159C66F5|nr:hypothetical protein [Priestia megaterium]
MLGLLICCIATLVFIYDMVMKRIAIGTIGFLIVVGVFFFYPGVSEGLAEIAPQLAGPISGTVK